MHLAHNRVAAVRGVQFGSGTLLSSRLVLTAAHVVGAGGLLAPGDTPIDVYASSRVGWVNCSVVWPHHADDPNADVALLVADAELIPPDDDPELKPVSWGEFRNLEPRPGCYATGFPAVGRDRGARPRPEQFWGTLAPGTNSGNGRLVLSSEAAPPTSSPGEKSPWSGLSGAAVFFRQLLVGVVVEDDRPKRWRHTRLGVLATATLFADSSFLGALKEHLGSGVRLRGVTEQEITDAAFENRYAEAVQAEFGKIRIFGIDLHRSHSRGLDLDTAYLSLEALSSTQGLEGEEEVKSQSVRVERILKGRHRVLLRGQAGSGKSTLMQWLAIKSISGSLSGDLAELNNRVPFILRLRAMYRLENLHPSPNEFLEIGNLPISSEQPAGWANRVLHEGRALLLVDGMDEIPDEKRHEAKEWLGWILNHYPKVWVLVTVRPSAVPRDWLSDYGFSELALLPMSSKDRSVFIEKWHRAAGMETALSVAATQYERERVSRELRELQNNLIRNLEVTPQLAALTDSPLLCAMICALHRDRNGALPSGRMEIYRAALSMLLARRDQQRQVELELEEDEHRSLLQEIAAWLVSEGLVEGSREDAVNQIARTLPSLYRINNEFTANELYDHIVERSGLLTETTTSTFEFIHRTFQDYLAAQEFKEARNFKMLASRAREEQWGDVIRMAVGHCDHRDRAILLSNIVEDGDQANNINERRAIHLLAGSCLPYATRLDTNIRDLVLDRVRQHLPQGESAPRVELGKLATVGDDLISILPLSTPSAWVIDVLGEIRSERAFEAVEQVSQTGTASLDHLVQLWNSFDIARFAQRVLANIDCSSVSVWIQTAEQAYELSKLGPIGSVILDGVGGETAWRDVAGVMPRIKTRDLAMFNCEGLSNLDFLGHMKSLSVLDLFGCWSLRDASAICALQLDALELVDVVNPDMDVDQIRAILSSQSEVHSLGLGAMEIDCLNEGQAFPQISYLKLWYPFRGSTTYEKIATIFPNIERLALYFSDTERARTVDLAPFAGKADFTVDISSNSKKPRIRGRALFAPGSLRVNMSGR